MVADQPDGIGVRIQAARSRLNLTQGQLAERLNVTQATVSRWESGQAFTSTIDPLRRIATALDMTVCDLLDEDCAS